MGSVLSGLFPSYDKPYEAKTKWFPEFESKLADQKGKVIVITGCTSGTGFVCARTCAKKGAHVVMLNRASSRATEAERLVKEAAPQATIETIECDLQSMASVRAAAAELKSKFSSTGIDVLCCNAGVMALKDQATADGFDVQMQTNHLSHFLLAKDVFPLLEAAATTHGEARVVTHSSMARFQAGKEGLMEKYFGANGGNLGGDGSSMFFGGARWVRYGQTKLANSAMMYALDAKLKASGSAVKAVCAAPGLAATNLQVTTAGDGGMSETFIMRLSQSGEDGTMPLLKCCIGEASSGQFIEPGSGGGMWGPPALSKPKAIENDPAKLKMLWEASEKACGEWKI